jgi:hypothetical protein
MIGSLAAWGVRENSLAVIIAVGESVEHGGD